MSKFGWSYPAGAANDPMAPYNQDVYSEDDSDAAHGCGPACPGCPWCLPALPDEDDVPAPAGLLGGTQEAPAGPLKEGACPTPVFLCVCEHDEAAHSIVEYDDRDNEHWTCRVCGCRDFEVGS